jgi:tRNA G18 (ribose-2'-O)-methylase SpoU
VVRNANAFLAAEVHIVGRRRWNRRGAMVTDRYQHVRHHATLAAFAEWTHERDLPVLGIRELSTAVLAIRQFGSTRSINAAAASAVAMHEWVRRHAERPAAPARPAPPHRRRR